MRDSLLRSYGFGLNLRNFVSYLSMVKHGFVQLQGLDKNKTV